MVPDTPTTAEPAANRGALVCVRCLYTLTGLPEEGVCPECATPIELSRLARSWTYPSPDRLRPAIGALTTILTSIGACITAVFVGFFLFRNLAGAAGSYLNYFVLALCWGAWHVGWSRLASLDPTIPPAQRLPPANRALRIVTLVAALGPIVLITLTLLLSRYQGAGIGFGFISGVLMLGSLILMLVQIALGAAPLSRMATSLDRPYGFGRRLDQMWIVRLSAAAIALILLLFAASFVGLWGSTLAFATYAILLLALVVTLLVGFGHLIAALTTARAAMIKARGLQTTAPTRPACTPP